MPSIMVGNRIGRSRVANWTPQIPISLVATVFSSTRIDLTWDDNGEATADGIRIYISTDKVTWTEKATVLLGVQAYSANALTAGTLYFFKAVAYKGSKESSSSNVYCEVTNPLHIDFDTLTGITESGYNYSPGATGWADQHGLCTTALTGDFTFSEYVNFAGANSAMIGLRDDASDTAFNGANGGYDYFVWGAPTSGNYFRGYAGGNVADTGVVINRYDLLRLRRTSGVVYAEYYRNKAWNLIYQYPTSNSNPLYPVISFGGAGALISSPIKNIELSDVFMYLASSVFVFDGNSLTKGYTTGVGDAYYPYNEEMDSLSPFDVNIFKTYSNKGVNSQTSQQMEADAAADIDPLFDATVNNILVACEVGNDIILNSLTARDAVDNFWTYTDARKAVGFKVMTVNLQARSSLNNAVRLSANSLLLSEYGSHSDYFVDLASVPELSDSSNLTYFQADGIHNKQAGYQQWAKWIKQGILNLINDEL